MEADKPRIPVSLAKFLAAAILGLGMGAVALAILAVLLVVF